MPTLISRVTVNVLDFVSRVVFLLFVYILTRYMCDAQHRVLPYQQV